MSKYDDWIYQTFFANTEMSLNTRRVKMALELQAYQNKLAAMTYEEFEQHLEEEKEKRREVWRQRWAKIKRIFRQ